jgi:hypothetical protein
VVCVSSLRVLDEQVAHVVGRATGRQLIEHLMREGGVEGQLTQNGLDVGPAVTRADRTADLVTARLGTQAKRKAALSDARYPYRVATIKRTSDCGGTYLMPRFFKVHRPRGEASL